MPNPERGCKSWAPAPAGRRLRPPSQDATRWPSVCRRLVPDPCPGQGKTPPAAAHRSEEDEATLMTEMGRHPTRLFMPDLRSTRSATLVIEWQATHPSSPHSNPVPGVRHDPDGLRRHAALRCTGRPDSMRARGALTVAHRRKRSPLAVDHRGHPALPSCRRRLGWRCGTRPGHHWTRGSPEWRTGRPQRTRGHPWRSYHQGMKRSLVLALGLLLIPAAVSADPAPPVPAGLVMAGDEVCVIDDPDSGTAACGPLVEGTVELSGWPSRSAHGCSWPPPSGAVSSPARVGTLVCDFLAPALGPQRLRWPVVAAVAD